MTRPAWRENCLDLVAARSEEENDEEAPWLVGWLVVAIQDIQSQLLEIMCTCAIFSGEADARDEFNFFQPARNVLSSPVGLAMPPTRLPPTGWSAYIRSFLSNPFHRPHIFCPVEIVLFVIAPVVPSDLL